MRIFLTGAQGTGKSTIVKQLADIYTDHKLYDSMSKIFMDGDKNKQFTEDFQKRISLYCLNLYVNERNFICSRSYFDSIAYPLSTGDDRYSGIIDMVRMYKDQLFEDDCIYFYLPIEFEISTGGNDLRVTDIEYQKLIDRLIREEIKRINHARIYIITGTVEERISKIRDIIEITSK